MTDLLHTRQRIRYVILTFIISLVLSGLTAFPIQTGVQWLNGLLTSWGWHNGITIWFNFVATGINQSFPVYPFLSYGTDWLAFGHLVIALFFLLPWGDPVRYKGIINMGLVACIGVFPLAFIAGAIREIPFFWQLIDCSFGVIGFILLWWVKGMIQRLETHQNGYFSDELSIGV